MPEDRGTWVVRNMDYETRKAVADYAALRNERVADVLQLELQDLVLHMRKVWAPARDAAIAMTTRTED
jgi:hypothetical protein